MSKRLIKKTLGLFGGAAVARRLTRFRPRILMYHGLTNDTDVREWTQVHVDDFRAQMRYIKSAFHPVSLTELVASLESEKISPLSIAITFDDGYRSSLDSALPILHEFGVPATIFVTSGFISGDATASGYLWPDQVTMILLSMTDSELDLSRFDAGKFKLSTEDERQAARSRLAEYLKTVADGKRKEIVDWLYETYGSEINYDRFAHLRPLTPEELRGLANDDLITIGAHTRTHPILSRLGGEELADEIVGGKEDVERMTGRDVIHFAYPNGRRQDIGPVALELTGKHFRSAVTTEPGLCGKGANKYLLPRIGVGRSLTMPEFTTHLAGIYHMLRGTASEM